MPVLPTFLKTGHYTCSAQLSLDHPYVAGSHTDSNGVWLSFHTYYVKSFAPKFYLLTSPGLCFQSIKFGSFAIPSVF